MAKNIILITGANGGIGLELASQLLADASMHILLGSRSAENGDAAVQELQSRGKPGTVELLQVDVSSEDSIRSAANTVETKHGRLDALVNNAGIGRLGENMATEMADCFRTNVIGPQLMMDYFVPLLRRSSGIPRIINVTSGAGSMQVRLKPNAPGAGIRAIPYQASKSALNMVTLQAFLDYGKEGIKVFLYCPGFTASNLGSHNKVESGAKPTAEGAGPMVPILNGERDADAGKYLNWNGEWPW